MNFDPSNWEPLLDDSRVEQVAQKIKSQFGHRKLEDATFFTFIQPARMVNVPHPDFGVKVPKQIPEMAVFAIISPRPNGRPGQRLMTTATVALKDWLEREAEVGHFVGAPDEAHQIYRVVAADHLQKIQSAKELIQ